MRMFPKDEDGHYPLWLQVAAKEALFCVAEDPRLEDGRAVLERIEAAIMEHQS